VSHPMRSCPFHSPPRQVFLRANKNATMSRRPLNDAVCNGL
jgi:hypothetical protein